MPALSKEITKMDAHQDAMGPHAGMFFPVVMDSQRDVDLMETHAALIQAEAVIRLQEERIHQLQQLTLTDELTGLVNRRGFTAAFERELALSRRDADYGGILVMVDLDKFKGINDRWGHQTGDAYLCAVAETLAENVRASDTVARLGGDEFALLLTHLDEKSGAKRLARLEASFAQKHLILGKDRIPLRGSFGFAAYGGGDAVEAVMQAADLRLYGNKARNKKLIAAR